MKPVGQGPSEDHDAQPAEQQSDEDAGHGHPEPLVQHEGEQAAGRGAHGAHEGEFVAPVSQAGEQGDEHADEGQAHDEQCHSAQGAEADAELLGEPVHFDGGQRDLHGGVPEEVGQGEDGQGVFLLEQDCRDLLVGAFDVGVDPPDRFNGGQQELVDDRPRGAEDADDGVDLIPVDVGAILEAVGAEEGVSDAEPRRCSGFCSDRDFEGRIEQPAFCHFCVVVFGIACLCADDAEEFVVVTVGQRNGRFDVRVAHHLARIGEGNVAGGHVDVIDVGEDGLQRASLGGEHQVDVLDVAVEVFGQAALHEQHQADDADSEGEEQHAQAAFERPVHHVAAG